MFKKMFTNENQSQYVGKEKNQAWFENLIFLDQYLYLHKTID